MGVGTIFPPTANSNRKRKKRNMKTMITYKKTTTIGKNWWTTSTLL